MLIFCRLLFNRLILFYDGKEKGFSPIHLSFQGIKKYEKIKQAKKQLTSFLYLKSRKKQNTM